MGDLPPAARRTLTVEPLSATLREKLNFPPIAPSPCHLRMTRRDDSPGLLDGQRVVLVGRLASMSKRDATRLIREHGGTVVDRPAADVHWVVVGEAELPLADLSATEEWFDQPTRESADRGVLRVATETQLWQHLGLVDQEQEVHRLYTPAMLADLVGVEIGIVRRWHRRGACARHGRSSLTSRW